MKKIIPVVVALVLILIIGGVAVGGMLLDKYSYSKETADLTEYYGVTGERLAIVLQDEIVPEQAVRRDGACYFDLDTVHAYFDEGFYVDTQEQLLLYTTATDTYRVDIGSGSWQNSSEMKDLGCTICFIEGDKIYVAADYLKLFANFSYEVFNDLCMQVYTEWGTREVAEVVKDTQVRSLGGIKSPILRQVARGETVEILNQMETWSEVKTSDSIIGYIENKRLSELTTETEAPVMDHVPDEYTSLSMAGKVSLGWHSIGGVGGNDTLSAMVAESKGMNVIAPTWFSLNDNEGNFRSFGTTRYVEQAHGYGLQVWGVWDNFNYKNETGADIDSYAVLSSTSKRQLLVQGMIGTALSMGLDGINIDFEGLTEDIGVHYIQFLRELSVECRKNGLVLSIDNYVPFHFNEFYRLDIQGEIADYVIIMGYDEHWHGSGNPGSVASIDYVSNGITKTLEQVPAEKVVNALPFYTILWKTEGANVTDEYITLNNMTDFLQRVNITPEWDEETCQNYAEWQSGSATYQIWVEDLESLKVKLSVMSAQNIAGVAVWRLGYGTPGAWELINAYAGL
ncbi:MAG: glycosyl hydrolase family 18 protein [Lachnospiraceae bacterium]|nr:glycosyl hydrolase family 18 protein [Butyrivibrio sp.]MCM1344442.1 glycosyl hydrolase family 18 protein [Muribaculaceae bacterium]MCM1411146.1 glycosyl hydrolase family 18 protein [Lachnospiraceae bacterium]